MSATASPAVPDRPATPPPSPTLGAVAATRVFVARSLRHSLRDVESLLMAAALPISLMLVFTFVFGGAMNADALGGDYLNYVVPGIAITCAGFGAAGTAVAVNLDLTTGVIARLRSMPVPAATVLAGHTVASLARNLVATALVLGVAALLGWWPAADGAQWVVAVAVIAAWILAITAVFALLGLVSGSPSAASGYGFALLFLPYVSSAFAPVSTMPDWLRPIAEHLPVTPVVESMRGLFTGGWPGADIALALAWSAGLTLIAALGIALLFRRRSTD